MIWIISSSSSKIVILTVLLFKITYCICVTASNRCLKMQKFILFFSKRKNWSTLTSFMHTNMFRTYFMKNDLWFSAFFMCTVIFEHAASFNFNAITYNMTFTSASLSNIVIILSFSTSTEYFSSFTAQKSFMLNYSFIIFSDVMIILFIFISVEERVYNCS